MPDKSLNKINELLNEEKWTRAAINSYTINNFKELDLVIEQAKQSDNKAILSEAKELCAEHLTHTKNSIIALYISGIIALNHQLIDDSNLIFLISIFADNHKWNIVEYLCNKILEFGENKMALRTLAECYDTENDDENKFEIWKRLIKVDYIESDIVKHLAEKEESEGNMEMAVEYYKKAIHRFIGKKLYTNVKDIWLKLIEFCPEEIDFFFHVDRKIARTLNEERASQLLEELYKYYKENELWDTSIEILKRILSYDSKNIWARKEITSCYQGKFSYHSHLDEYIKLSNLNQSWRNVFDAIADFEKHISFDAGNFVFHRSWGVGRISSIENDTIIIDFAKKRSHMMSLKMAVNALTSLIKEHIWVLKSIWSKDKLYDKVKNDIGWTLRTIIKSHNNAADMKQIKSEVVPGILTQGEWTSWSIEARKILKTDSQFGNLPDNIDQYVVRENPISYEEKSFNKFKAEPGFFAKLNTIQDFINNSDPESDLFGEMFSYFTNFLKAFTVVNETVISSFLLIQGIISKYPFLNPGFSHTFKTLIKETEDITELFTKIENTELKRVFLENVIQHLDNWADIYIRLFPHYLNKFIIDELAANNEQKKLKDLFSTLLARCKENREAFIWIARNLDKESWMADYDITYEKVLISMIHLLDVTFREINNRRDVSTNRKYNKQVHTFLFKDHKLEEFILTSEQESITRLFTLVQDVKGIDPSVVIKIKHQIMEKYPKFKFYGEVVTETVSRGLMVTAKSMKRKQKELKEIIDIEIPKNAKEIGAAIELGDLSENAEYKAGKEKQEMLNIAVGKLKEDLDKARIFDPKDVDPASISFGTKVLLKNIESGKDEEYIFLGPWESDPSRHIISYLSPFGNELWTHTEGEEIKFSINESEYNYKIKEIKSHEF